LLWAGRKLLATLKHAPAIIISDFHPGPTERGSDSIECARTFGAQCLQSY
jgi:hypothetical protein